MAPMNGATIHSTSPKRYSPSTNPVLPAPDFLASGSTSNAPLPSATRGGSPGEPRVTSEPKVIWADAECGTEVPNARSKSIPVRYLNVLLKFPPIPRWLRFADAILKGKLCSTSGNHPAANSDPLHSFRRQDQLLANARLHCRMAGIGNDSVCRFGPGASQFVGAADRTDHVVAPLHDYRRQMPNLSDAGD